MNGRLVALCVAFFALLPACERDPCMKLADTCATCSNISLAESCASAAVSGDPVVCESVQKSYADTCALVDELYTTADGTDGSDGTGGTSETDGTDGTGGSDGTPSDSGIVGRIEQ